LHGPHGPASQGPAGRGDHPARQGKEKAVGKAGLGDRRILAMTYRILASAALVFAFALVVAPRSLAADPPKELTAQELETLWNDLPGEDAKKAWAAINILARNPKQALPLYKEKLKPMAPIDAERVEKLIKDLDSNQFAERQKAEVELEKLQELAQPALKK